MSTFYFIFLIVAAPICFFMLTWTVVTTWRILFPEKPLPLEKDPVFVRQRSAAAGIQVPVGAREIREDQRYHQSTDMAESYIFAFGTSNGIPPGWMDDLWRRRN